jgi:type IV secretory pathway VirJ component
MKKSALLLISFLCIQNSRIIADSPNDSLSVGSFGKVFVYKKTPLPRNVVIIISGDGGWKMGVTGFAESFSEMNSLVIGVDILRYYRNLRQRTDSCYNVAADFVQLATEIEKKFKFPDYRPPVIMGYSSGATLVYGILAQSRPGTFMGGISLGFCPDIELPKMLCQVNGLTGTVLKPGKSYLFQPDARLGNPWVVLHGKADKVCDYQTVEDFVKKTTDAELITLPKVGHGFSNWSDFMPQWKEAYNRITGTYEKDLAIKTSVETGNRVSVVITKAKSENKDAPIALIISGDGGWYSFEQMIADHLAKSGIPTIGLDSKKYFWNRKTPDETATDMIKTLNYYSKEWGRDRFILVGYSLGAEIVPFIVNRLPEDMRSKIVSSVLLSPETTTDFEIHVSNMLGMGNRQNTYNVTREIINMHPVPTLIILGSGEKSEIPDLLKGTSVIIKKLPGDHHYKFNLNLIIQTMKDNNAF